MLLVIDCGNTNIVCAIFSTCGKMKAQWRFATQFLLTEDDLFSRLAILMQLEGFSTNEVDSIVISTVVPSLSSSLERLCRDKFCVKFLFVDHESVKPILSIDTVEPESVGSDRLANAVAGCHKYGAPLLIVDLGTAVTFELVNEEKSYKGGAIFPGVGLSLSALGRKTGKLPFVHLDKPPSIIGDTTTFNIQSGIFWGYIGMVEGIVNRIREMYKAPLKVIGTGGNIIDFADDLESVIDHCDINLTLEGLFCIGKYHKIV